MIELSVSQQNKAIKRTGYGRKLVYLVVFSGLVYMGAALWAGLPDFAQRFRAFTWSYFPLALVLVFLGLLLRVWRWDRLLKTLGISVPWQKNLPLSFSGSFMTFTPGRVGEFFKAYLLKESQATALQDGITVVAAEKFLDVLSLTTLAVVGLALSTLREPIFIAITLTILGTMTGFLFLFIKNRRLGPFLGRVLSFLPFLRGLHPFLGKAYSNAQTLLQPKPLIWTWAMSLIFWTLECLAFYLLGLGLGLSIGLISSLYIFSLSLIMGAISLLPGGLGFAEGGLVGMLLLKGIARPDAVSYMLLTRLATLWFAALCGGVGLAVVLRRLGPTARPLDPGTLLAQAEDPVAPNSPNKEDVK